MAQISWGKPIIKIGLLGASDAAPSTWIDIPTPVQGSTILTTTKGQKAEAPLEGGGFEDVRYNKNTYALAFELYAKKGREKPVADVDGIVAGSYALKLQPEDPTVEGIVIAKGVLSVEDTWDASIGGKWKYTLDVLTPSTGNQVEWEVVTFTT